MYRNSPPLCAIVLQIPSLMPLKMRKVQPKATKPGTGDELDNQPGQMRKTPTLHEQTEMTQPRLDLI